MAVGPPRSAPSPPVKASAARRRGGRFRPQRLKREHPIATVVTAAGVAPATERTRPDRPLPAHDDGGRPNLYVYPHNDSYYCFRCGLGGDAIDFVMRAKTWTSSRPAPASRSARGAFLAPRGDWPRRSPPADGVRYARRAGNRRRAGTAWGSRSRKC